MLPEPIEVPGEKIYELITAADGLGYGVALVELTESRPHVHRSTSETYILVTGAVDVHIDDAVFLLRKPSDRVVIPLGARHWAEDVGDLATVLVVSTPAWTPDDHHPVP